MMLDITTSRSILSHLDYRRMYDRLKDERSLSFELMSRNQLQQFKSHNVPALRSVMDQNLRWLVPSGDFVPGATRYTPKRDLRIILQTEYFPHRDYANNIIVADNLINLVAQIVVDPVDCFSPKASKGLDNYPTVTIKGMGDKENNVSEEKYLTRFNVRFYWFHPAKSIARYVNYDLQEKFMRAFNDPHYHCFHMETTLLNKLAALGSRNESNIANLFWPSSGIQTTQLPFPDRFGSKERDSFFLKDARSSMVMLNSPSWAPQCIP